MPCMLMGILNFAESRPGDISNLVVRNLKAPVEGLTLQNCLGHCSARL